MEIKIELGADIRYMSPVLKVELYRSSDALLNPLDHPNDCFNCATLISLDESSKHDLAYSLINVIQASVNALLIRAEDKTIDIHKAMNKSMEQYGEALKNLADR